MLHPHSPGHDPADQPVGGDERVWAYAEKAVALRTRAHMAEAASQLLDPEIVDEVHHLVDEAVDEGLVSAANPQRTLEWIVRTLGDDNRFTDLIECDHATTRLVKFGDHLTAEGAPLSADLEDPDRIQGVAWFLEPQDDPCDCPAEHPLVIGLVWAALPDGNVRVVTLGWWPPTVDELGFTDGMHTVTAVFDTDGTRLLDVDPMLTWRANLARGLIGTHAPTYDHRADMVDDPVNREV